MEGAQATLKEHELEDAREFVTSVTVRHADSSGTNTLYDSVNRPTADV